MRSGILRVASFIFVLLFLSGCQSLDPQQQQICERLIPALAVERGTPLILSVAGEKESGRDSWLLRLDYRLSKAGGGVPRDYWLLCRFAGGAQSSGRLDLIAVAHGQKAQQVGQSAQTDGARAQGAWLGSMDLAMLKVWLQITLSRQLGTAEAHSSAIETAKAILYGYQTLFNALVVCCLYMLLAAGYSLIYGLMERINLAFGQLTLVAGYGGLLGLVFALTSVGLPLYLALFAMLLTALGVGALLSDVLARHVMARVAKAPSQISLIVTLGLAFVFQEFLRLTQGGRDLWLPPILPGGVKLVDAGPWSLTLSYGQMLVVSSTFLAVLALLWLYRRSATGLMLRACADDPGAASLSGVSYAKVLRQAFLLSGALAGLAGALVVFYYGTIGFTGGALLGFKALTAAILGGIGSLPGALVGGMLIGLVETFWSAYLPGEHRDIAVFSLLILILVFRPQGLMGQTSDPLHR
ncbi:branched-chain amino acid ABC transporter permease [Rhodovibrionaceae bacterium A322]